MCVQAETETEAWRWKNWKKQALQKQRNGTCSFRACVRSPLLHAGDFSDNREAVLKFGNLHSDHISHLMPFSVISLIFQNRCSVPVDQASESLLKSKACFGAENLMRVLGNYCRLGEVRTHIRVGVVGKASGGGYGARASSLCRGFTGGKDSGNFMLLLAREERSCSGRVLLFFF